MKNLLNQKVQIDNLLTTDPFNKRGQVGTIIEVEVFDEESFKDLEYGSADVTIQFEDGTIGVYQLGTFEIV